MLAVAKAQESLQAALAVAKAQESLQAALAVVEAVVVHTPSQDLRVYWVPPLLWHLKGLLGHLHTFARTMCTNNPASCHLKGVGLLASLLQASRAETAVQS